MFSWLRGCGEACTVWPTDNTARLEDVAQDLDVEGPVAWVMKDERSGDGRLCEVDRLRERVPRTVVRIANRLCGGKQQTFVDFRSDSVRS